MANSNAIPRNERLNEAASIKEHEELVRRKQLYLQDLRKRVNRLRELKNQEKKKQEESIKEQERKKLEELRKLQRIGKIASQKKQELKELRNEKQKLYREERKERDYLTISVVLVLVAFGFGVIAVNYYTNFNGTIVGMTFFVFENNTVQEEFDLTIDIPANNKEITKFLRIDKPDGKIISFDVQRNADNKVKDLSDIVFIKVGTENAYIGTLPEKKKLDITSYVGGFCTSYPCKLPLNFSAQFETQIILENLKQQANGITKSLENAVRTEQPISRNKKQGDSVRLGVFKKGEIKTVELKKYDTVKFIIGNNQYNLQLEGISFTTAEISLLPAFDSIDLELTMPLRADLNNNELDDIIIILTNLDYNKATFSLQHLDEVAENEKNDRNITMTEQSSTRKKTETKIDEEATEKFVVENIKVIKDNADNNNDKENESSSSINFISWIVLSLLGLGIVGGISYWQSVEGEKARERKKWAIERYYMEHGKLPSGVKKEDYKRLKEKKYANTKKPEGSQKTAHYEVISMFVNEFKDKNYSDEKIKQELATRGWDPKEVQHVIKMQESKQVYSNIDSLIAFAEDSFNRGYKLDQIAKALHGKGWPKEVIVRVFKDEKRLRKYLR